MRRTTDSVISQAALRQTDYGDLLSSLIAAHDPDTARRGGAKRGRLRFRLDREPGSVPINQERSALPMSRPRSRSRASVPSNANSIAEPFPLWRCDNAVRWTASPVKP